MTDWQIDLLIERALNQGGTWLLMGSVIAYLLYLRSKFGMNDQPPLVVPLSKLVPDQIRVKIHCVATI